jgi:hypothetical protein
MTTKQQFLTEIANVGGRRRSKPRLRLLRSALTVEIQSLLTGRNKKY